MEDKEKARELYQQARELALSSSEEPSNEVIRICLELVTEAYRLFPKEVYKKRMNELDAALKDSSSRYSESVEMEELTTPSKKESTSKSDSQNSSCISSLENRNQDITNVENGNALATAGPSGVKLNGDINFGSIIPTNPGPSQVSEVMSVKNTNDKSLTINISGFRVRSSIHSKLYGYQVQGVEWLLNLFKLSLKSQYAVGAILADDMGLGKTVQSITAISALIDSSYAKSVLVVAPNTLLVNWGKEFKKWCPFIDIHCYHEGSLKKRRDTLKTVQRYGGVLFTTYSLLQNHIQYFKEFNSRMFVWDFVIFDEAHKIKNPTKTTKAAAEIPSKFRLAVTGTPVQNNLRELWAIYDWTHKGELFGSYNGFKINYEKPISESRKKGGNPTAIKTGIKLASDLKKIYAPYFLRRTKDQVFGCNGPVSLPKKYDFVVWIKLTEDQITAYRAFLSSEEIKDLLRSQVKAVQSVALVKINLLLKICQSINLIPSSSLEKMTKELASKRRRRRKVEHDLDASHLVDDDGQLIDINNIDISELFENAAKLQFLVDLLENLRANGHRTIVFSQSIRVLNMIQRILTARQFRLGRLDGNVKQKDRDLYIATFQESTTIDVMLVTTGVGGVGLTLTNADRVVIFDPSWNPGQDAQAIDRAYRIGQTKPVIVYRLITCSTVEERIFRRQIYKSSLFRQMVQQEEDPLRYFTDGDIRDLFQFEDPNVSETYAQIEDLHGSQRVPCAYTDEHRRELCTFQRVYNVSDYSLLFSLAGNDDDIADANDAMIQNAVAQSKMTLMAETQAQKDKRLQTGNFHKDFELPVQDQSPQSSKTTADLLPNPTEIDDSIIIEDENVSQYFPSSFIQIDDSDVYMSPSKVKPTTSKRSSRASQVIVLEDIDADENNSPSPPPTSDSSVSSEQEDIVEEPSCKVSTSNIPNSNDFPWDDVPPPPSSNSSDAEENDLPIVDKIEELDESDILPVRRQPRAQMIISDDESEEEDENAVAVQNIPTIEEGVQMDEIAYDLHNLSIDEEAFNPLAHSTQINIPERLARQSDFGLDDNEQEESTTHTLENTLPFSDLSTKPPDITSTVYFSTDSKNPNTTSNENEDTQIIDSPGGSKECLSDSSSSSPKSNKENSPRSSITSSRSTPPFKRTWSEAFIRDMKAFSINDSVLRPSKRESVPNLNYTNLSIEVEEFDKTNHALDPVNRNEEDQQDESPSPSSQSYPLDESFSLDTSLLKTPTQSSIEIDGYFIPRDRLSNVTDRKSSRADKKKHRESFTSNPFPVFDLSNDDD